MLEHLLCCNIPTGIIEGCRRMLQVCSNLKAVGVFRRWHNVYRRAVFLCVHKSCWSICSMSVILALIESGWWLRQDSRSWCCRFSGASGILSEKQCGLSGPCCSHASVNRGGNSKKISSIFRRVYYNKKSFFRIYF